MLVRVVSRLLLPPTLVIAAGILVKGYAEPGDGFSAGVVAGLGILLQYLAFGRGSVERLLPPLVPGVLTFAGMLLALTVAAVPLFLGDPVLTHYPPPGTKPIYLGTLELITAVSFDVGIFLLVFGFTAGAIQIVAHAQDDERDAATASPPEEAA